MFFSLADVPRRNPWRRGGRKRRGRRRGRGVILVLFSVRCAQEEPLEKRGEEEEGEEERKVRRREQDQRKATIAQILISMGANVNARNDDGHTANKRPVRIQ